MTDFETDPQSEHDRDEDADRGAPGGPSTEHDPAGPATPPGNPPTDDEAVEKGRDQLGRITGR